MYSATTVQNQQKNPHLQILNVQKCVSYNRLLRTTAWVFRYIRNIKKGQFNGSFKAQELTAANNYWISEAHQTFTLHNSHHKEKKQFSNTRTTCIYWRWANCRAGRAHEIQRDDNEAGHCTTEAMPFYETDRKSSSRPNDAWRCTNNSGPSKNKILDLARTPDSKEVIGKCVVCNRQCESSQSSGPSITAIPRHSSSAIPSQLNSLYGKALCSGQRAFTCVGREPGEPMPNTPADNIMGWQRLNNEQQVILGGIEKAWRSRCQITRAWWKRRIESTWKMSAKYYPQGQTTGKTLEEGDTILLGGNGFRTV